jgi:membrane protein
LEESSPVRAGTIGPISLSPPEPGLGTRVRGFLFRVISKALEDNIFFMAGAITFNLLVALVPLALLFVGISGFVLTSRFPDPASVLMPLLLGNLPETGADIDLVSGVEGVINTLLADRRSFSLLGSFVFLWVSTRLVGTLRTVLREIFDFPHGRGIIEGKIFDGIMVVVGGLLFVVNIGITVLTGALEEQGSTLLGLHGEELNLIRQVTAQGLAFGSIYVLFILIYRYFPPRRIPWRTALTAATFTAVLFEFSKVLFSWYVTNVASFSSVYGGLTSVVVLFFWIYYGAIVFILGGEVAQVYTMSRVRRLHAASSPPGGGL